MAKLEIQSHIRIMIRPSTPTPNHLRTLNLSFFDQLVSPSLYIPMLYYYTPNSERDKADCAEKCAKFQTSLAETLAKFYPLAGRLRKHDLSIHCNDEGVEYAETKVNTDLVEFLNEGPKIFEHLIGLLPWNVTPSADLPSTPLLGVQVNIFNCGGLVIGIQLSHILADAFTFATFVNEWAHISQTGTPKGCFPSFSHLPSLFPTRQLSAPPQFSPTSSTRAKIVTGRFVFDALAIAKLKDEITTLTKPSRLVAVTSLVWKVLVGISSAKHGHSRDSCLLFAINLRGKTKLPSTEHALGNFTMFAISTLEAKQSRRELNDFVNLVGNTIRDTSAGIGNSSADDISSLISNNHTKVLEKLCQGDKADAHIFSSWCKFPWYDADFGWGKPYWVSSASNNTCEAIGLVDTKDGDGIEARVCLKENVMAEFERDTDILTFCQPLTKIP